MEKFFTVKGYFRCDREIHKQLLHSPKPKTDKEVETAHPKKRVSIAACFFFAWIQEFAGGDKSNLAWCFSLYLATKMFTGVNRIFFVLNSQLSDVEDKYGESLRQMWADIREKEPVYLAAVVRGIQKYGRANYWEMMKIKCPEKKAEVLPWIGLALKHGRIDVPMEEFLQASQFCHSYSSGTLAMKTPKPSAEHWSRFCKAMGGEKCVELLEMSLDEFVDRPGFSLPSIRAVFSICNKLFF